MIRSKRWGYLLPLIVILVYTGIMATIRLHEIERMIITSGILVAGFLLLHRYLRQVR